MMVDSSAIMAILRGEPEAESFAAQLIADPAAVMSAVTYVEAGAAIDRFGDPVLSRRLDEVLDLCGVEVVPFDAAQAAVARAAYADFGRGTGHPARLSFGDCCAYAAAIHADEPLLVKGAEFGHTDVRVAQ